MGNFYEVLTTLIKKIELQSILILVITLGIGHSLIILDNAVIQWLGIACIIFGLLYTYASFFTNNMRESYKDIISEYRATIASLRENYSAVSATYQTVTNTLTKNMDDDSKHHSEYTSPIHNTTSNE